MSKKKVLMQRFNGTGYDPQYPETHVKNVTGVNQTVANNVGVAATDGATVIGEMSEIDYFVSPQGTTTGTSTAYNLNIGSQYTSLDDMDGVVIRAKFHTTTGDNPTLNVNGLGAKPILAENGANIPYQIGENVWATLIWSSTLNGWIVQGWGKKRVFKTELITKTTNWIVPDVAGQVSVRLFGGGAGGRTGYSYTSSSYGCGGGGGGGHMKFNTLILEQGNVINITIGAGGSSNSSGGTTSFGTLLSANGANGMDGGSGGGDGYRGGRRGGNGSYGGGGGAGYIPTSWASPGNGGNGGTYGGGGVGGRGGQYYSTGGSGGGGKFAGGTSDSLYAGGGGGGYSSPASGATAGEGQNTVGMGLDFEGEGKGGGYGRSGGGYGGNGSYGGGGYGADGGNGGQAGGGGGGYGGRGGDGASGGGGGGGYGLNGTGGRGAEREYFTGSNGGIAAGGGGGGGDDSKAYAGGKGGNGICILTYWAWE